MADLNNIDEHGVPHACPLSEDGLGPDLGEGGYSPMDLSYPCGCTPEIHRFQCVWCRRIVGWCMGCAHENPELPEDLCDACWVEAGGWEDAS